MDEEKQQKQAVKEGFDELFEFENEDERKLHEARMVQYRFLHKVERKMEKWGMNKKELANELRISEKALVDVFRGEIFLDWLTFYKMKEYFEINVCFFLEDDERM